MSAEKSGIPKEYMKYFVKVDTVSEEYGINVCSIGLWILICIAIFRETGDQFSAKSGKSGLKSSHIMFFTCAMMPLTIFLYKIYNAYHRQQVKDRPYVAPDFGVCFIPWQNLKENEKKAGIIGAIDMQCNKMNQSNYSFSLSQAIQHNTYYLIYTMFTLTLLFFPLPENFPFDKDSPLVRILIKLNMLVVLMLLSSPIFMGRIMRQVGFSLNHLFYNLTIMSAALTIMTISFIISQIMIRV